MALSDISSFGKSFLQAPAWHSLVAVGDSIASAILPIEDAEACYSTCGTSWGVTCLCDNIGTMGCSECKKEQYQVGKSGPSNPCGSCFVSYLGCQRYAVYCPWHCPC